MTEEHLAVLRRCATAKAGFFKDIGNGMRPARWHYQASDHDREQSMVVHRQDCYVVLQSACANKSNDDRLVTFHRAVLLREVLRQMNDERLQLNPSDFIPVRIDGKHFMRKVVCFLIQHANE